MNQDLKKLLQTILIIILIMFASLVLTSIYSWYTEKAAIRITVDAKLIGYYWERTAAIDEEETVSEEGWKKPSGLFFDLRQKLRDTGKKDANGKPIKKPYYYWKVKEWQRDGTWGTRASVPWLRDRDDEPPRWDPEFLKEKADLDLDERIAYEDELYRFLLVDITDPNRKFPVEVSFDEYASDECEPEVRFRLVLDGFGIILERKLLTTHTNSGIPK